MYIHKVWCPDETDEESAPEWPFKYEYQYVTDAAEQYARKRYFNSDYPVITIVHIRTGDGELVRCEVEARQEIHFYGHEVGR